MINIIDDRISEVFVTFLVSFNFESSINEVISMKFVCTEHEKHNYFEELIELRASNECYKSLIKNGYDIINNLIVNWL